MDHTAAGTLVQMKGLEIGYRGSPLLSGIDLAIHRGEYLGLIGPNGAGKSTFLKTLLGILPPRRGTIEKARGLRVGYVPQRTRLDPIFAMSALEVVRSGGMGTRPEGSRGWRLSSATRREGIDALERLGIADLMSLPQRDLSGGQQQRVLMARALVRSPDILILDEPTAGMDIPAEDDLLRFIDNLHRESRLTVILVVHQISIVAGRVDTLALINKDIPLFAVGAAEELLHPDRLGQLYRHPMSVSRNAATDEISIRSKPAPGGSR